LSAARSVLRTVLIALFFAFVVGFGIGTWLRCRMEKPPTFIGAAPAPHERSG
jgi:hypothetical protein